MPEPPRLRLRGPDQLLPSSTSETSGRAPRAHAVAAAVSRLQRSAQHHRAHNGDITFDRKRNAASFNYRFNQDSELSGPMTLRLRVSTKKVKDPRLFVGIEKWSHGEPVPFEGLTGTAATAPLKDDSGLPCVNSTRN